MNYITAPGIIKINALPEEKASGSKSVKSFITISVKTRKIFFSMMTQKQLSVKAGERVRFIILQDEFFICKGVDGAKLIPNGASSLVAVKSGFTKAVQEVFRVKKNIVCVLKKTNSEFNGYPLFKINFPKIYKSKTKQLCTHMF